MVKKIDYDDFYNEPSEFNLMVIEFKDGLMKAVKQEFMLEMEQLKAENEKLQNIKEHWEELERKYKDAVGRLDYEISKAKNMALIDLLDSVKVIMYTAGVDYLKKPKCDKCNERRQVAYITPLGRKASEDCDVCHDHVRAYTPKEAMLYEFEQRHRGKPVTAWYKKIERQGDRVLILGDTYSRVKVMHDGTTPYEELDCHDVMFKTEEECQKYCDWLNRDNLDAIMAAERSVTE